MTNTDANASLSSSASGPGVWLRCHVCNRELSRRADAPKLEPELEGEEMIWFCTEHGSPLILQFLRDRAAGKPDAVAAHGVMIDGKYVCYVPLLQPEEQKVWNETT